MHCAISRRVTARALSLAAATLAATSLLSQPAGNADLDRVRAQIAQTKQRLESVRQQAASAEHDLEVADLELSLRTQELQLAVDLQSRLETQRVTLESELASIGPQMERQRAYLRKRVVALSRAGSLGYLRLFLSIDRDRDPLEALSMLRYLISRDTRALRRFRTAQAELADRRNALEKQQQQIAAARQVVEQRRRGVEASKNEKARLLASLRTAEAGGEKQLAELEEKARRLERLVTVLSQQSGGNTSTLDVRSVQGALPWPVQGKLIEKFGRQRNPKFATYTMNNGVKIAASAGVPVKAVFQGTVLFSQWFKGYGNLVIVDHGNRVFSLYGNVKAPSIAVGDHVAAGQAIAGVGEGEDGQGGYLYFEVRQDNHPQDPQKWLR